MQNSQEIYPRLVRKSYTVNWKDEDGDDVVISTDEEMMTALTALRGDLVKLNVYLNEDEKVDDCDILITAVAENPATAGPCPATHYGVVCDACNSQVVGFRYKCVACDDFDLCATCEGAGLHPEHCMVRVPSPMMPRALIKAAIKRSRHFFKTVANAATDENCHKRHRREKCGEPKQHGDRHHGERHHGDHHHRRPRSSWLDTFTTYMNEFANLAGDVSLDNEEPKVSQTKTQQAEPEKPQTSTQSQAPSSSSKQPEPEQNTSAKPTMTECPFMPGVENLSKLFEMYMNGSLAPLIQQFAQQAQQHTASTHAAPTPSNNEDVEMSQASPKPQEKDEVSVKSETSTTSSSESVKDLFGEKVEGWTVINQEKDLAESTEKPSAPAEAPGPIGFNLPQAFQKHVTINEGQNIYPPLNAATAVLNPKEPESTPLQAPLKPQPAPIPNTTAPRQAQPNPNPTAPRQAQPNPGFYPHVQPDAGTYPQPGAYPHPQTRPLHSLAPHIAAALQQMLAMGFTNEAGWLTQLLENTNGNISAVMDLLTPVKPM